MKDSETETNGPSGASPEQLQAPESSQTASGGETGRDTMLREVFELQMGMLWLAQKAMRELTARHELHPPHLMILNLLDGRHPDMLTLHQGGLNMSDFSRGMDIPPASATAMIDRMIAQELVERGPSEQDRRVVMVRLTERGRAVVGEINALWQQIQRDAFMVLSDDQLSAHLTLMRRLQEGYLQRFPEEAAPRSGNPAFSHAHPSDTTSREPISRDPVSRNVSSNKENV